MSGCSVRDSVPLGPLTVTSVPLTLAVTPAGQRDRLLSDA